jgi:type I restriction enzyme M protein
MLDQETKRKIDNARDILVGKVPDPKSQVEQITIALIYKFMDDMDKESEGWGGKASFFTGKYKKYAWSNIFDPRLGGFDLIGLYGDAIVEMNQNPNIPQLFRDIFKNAYLPYRDPETLKSFLKEINEFNYDHSEQLGDAFEYLLSVMDSQGDAGQFRTPRHIIDFIVEIVAPKKNDTVVDPACGTAGFLISSYKHILKANTKKQYGDKLTPDEKKRLMNNFMGYDISPDMVRLSLVNMYLHGFSDPKIMEYDTLTSEERWDETSDVMLANPPFMTPKGGIRPHKRFSIQAKRSEVLFVDYIAEHLNPNGRAGVIVPEGIIFQSQNAYKNLRKMLVDDYLWAVVSLPAGVFNPYAGVKTSILLMDKSLSKKTDKILFVKIENDGFDLGAQRRHIDKNDLPQALDFTKGYKKAVMKGTEVAETDFAHIVEKSKIAESGDWNLSGERYKKNNDVQTSNFKLMKFDEVCTLEYGKSLPKKNRIHGEYPVVGSNGITGWHNNYLVDPPVIVVGRKGSAGEVVFINKPCFPIDTTYYVKPVNSSKVEMKYLYHILKELDLPCLKNGAGIPGLNRNDVYAKHEIPLPPLDVQKAIVGEIDSYQKIIDGARQVVDNYKPRIAIDPEWEMVKLGEVCEPITKGTTPTTNGFKWQKSGINFIKIENVNSDGTISDAKLAFIDEDCHASLKRSQLQKNDILFSIAGTKMGITGMVHEKLLPANTNQALAIIRSKGKVEPLFLLHYLMSESVQTDIERLKVGVAQFNLSLKQVSELLIPLSDKETQTQIVAQIEKEQSLVNANKELITLFEQKIKDKIASVWGE